MLLFPNLLILQHIRSVLLFRLSYIHPIFPPLMRPHVLKSTPARTSEDVIAASQLRNAIVLYSEKRPCLVCLSGNVHSYIEWEGGPYWAIALYYGLLAIAIIDLENCSLSESTRANTMCYTPPLNTLPIGTSV